jgi:hypothetical protein
MGFYRGPNVVTNGLVLNLDAANNKSYPGSGNTWRDLSGNNNNGTLINGPTFNSTNGGSIVFDGVDDYVSFIYTPLVAFLNKDPYTLEVFTQAQSAPSYPGFINRESNIGTRDGYNLIYTQVGQPTGQVFIFTERFTSGIQVAPGFTTLTSSFFNNWHHIVSTYDGNNLSLYYDGIFQSSASSTGNITNTSKALEIAARNGDEYKGNLSISRIYNRALSASEVLQNYNATKSRFNLT